MKIWVMNQEGSYKTVFNTFENPEKAATVLADIIMEQTKIAIHEKGRCVWAVSGGSSILKVYDALSDHKEFFGTFGKSLMVTWVDERVVPHTHQKSNYGNAKNYFWEKFEDVQLIPVPFKEDSDQGATAFKSDLEKKNIHQGDIDIIILGMGSDGHTASLFPFNEKLREETKDVVPVVDSSVDLERVSMTFPFINSSTTIYLYFYGMEKGKTIRNAFSSKDQKKYPVLGIDWKKTEVYTDQIL